ncbi:DMT family transporter [Streptomyces sp. PR69]|uniref:DMT family transporter n=1 Tax=Streptomyces sp. PR69 TaxID=2984950 RepID=UPI002264DE1D|nr:DMT family transporter [Streptomyces sp. PR69]
MAHAAQTRAARSTAPAPAPGSVRRMSAAGLLLAALATVVWSGSFITSRALHDSVPPVQAAFWRWIAAIAVLAPFALRATWRQRALIRRHLGYVTLAALLGVTLYNTLVNQAGLTAPASSMGMIMAASPVLMAVYERLGGVRLGLRRTAGLAVACLGVLLLSGGGALPDGFAAGELWMFAAAVSFASYSALLRRRPPQLGGLPFLFASFVLGALLLAPAHVLSVAVQGGFEPTAATVGPLVYVGVFSSALAYFAWNKAVALIGPARAGVVYHLQPVCVAALSFVLLGERTGPAQLLCMALILGGVALAAAGRPR